MGVTTWAGNGLPSIEVLLRVSAFDLAISLIAATIAFLSIAIETNGGQVRSIADWLRVGLAGLLTAALIVPVTATLVFRSSPTQPAITSASVG